MKLTPFAIDIALNNSTIYYVKNVITYLKIKTDTK